MQVVKNQYRIFIIIISLILFFLIISSYYLIKSQINLSSKVMQKHANIFANKTEDDFNAFYTNTLYLVNSETLNSYLLSEKIDQNIGDKLKIYYEKYHELISSITISNSDYQRIYYRTENNNYTLSSISYQQNPNYKLKYSKTLSYDKDYIVLTLPIKNSKGIICANFELLLNLNQYLINQMKRYYIDEDTWLISLDPNSNQYLYIHEGILIPSQKIYLSNLDNIINVISSKLTGKIIHYIKYNKHKIYLISGFSPIKIFDQTYGIIASTPRNQMLLPVVISTLLFVLLILITLSLFIILFNIYKNRIKKAKFETIQSESSFNSLIELLPLGIISFDNQEIITITNPELRKMFLINENTKLNGLKIDSIDCSDLAFAVKFNSGNAHENIQKISIMQNKEKKWFLKYKLSHQIGENIENMILFIDITNQENAFQLAEESNKARVEFLSNISHEIKTPLTSIKGFSSLLIKKDLDDEGLYFLDNIRKSTDNLLDLFTHIISLAKLEANQYTLNLLPVDIQQIVKEISKIYKSEKEVKFKVKLTQDLPIIITDMDKIKLILHNLINNSFKFTNKGEILFETALLHQTDNEATIKFNIKDTGIGIPKDKQEVIFEPFVQADGSFTREHNGIGIGLAISSKLAKLLGSNIILEESNEKGSLFSLTLTLEKYKEIKEL